MFIHVISYKKNQRNKTKFIGITLLTDDDRLDFKVTISVAYRSKLPCFAIKILFKYYIIYLNKTRLEINEGIKKVL